MTFHVPFNQREARRRANEPIYIGFETPVPPRPKFNWWGFNGMWMSVASLFATAGLFSFVPLIVSLVGLRRPGKTMATIGVGLSLVGMLFAGGIITTAVVESQGRAHRQHQAEVNRQVRIDTEKTTKVLKEARDELIEYRGSNDGQLPNDLDGNLLVVGHLDAWGKSLRFEPGEGNAVIRSAGPDNDFLTGDDVKIMVKGKSQVTEKHVPVSLD